MSHVECKKLLSVSKALIEKSGLARYNGKCWTQDIEECKFEQFHTSFDPIFGRYMLWLWFSVGAENLAKAALVCGSPGLPTSSLGYKCFTCGSTDSKYTYSILHGNGEACFHLKDRPKAGTLWKFYNSGIDKLREEVGDNIKTCEWETLKASYKYLADVVRNRDSHIYVENVRRNDFPAVKGLFVPGFNTLVRVMKHKGHNI